MEYSVWKSVRKWERETERETSHYDRFEVFGKLNSKLYDENNAYRMNGMKKKKLFLCLVFSFIFDQFTFRNCPIFEFFNKSCSITLQNNIAIKCLWHINKCLCECICICIYSDAPLRDKSLHLVDACFQSIISAYIFPFW